MGFGFGVKQRTDRKRTVSSSSSSTIVPQENQKNESTLNSKEANSTVGKSAVNIRDSKTKAAIDSCMNTVILCVMVDMMGISLTVPINVAYALQVQGNPQSCIADYYSTECSEAMAALKIKTGYLATAASIAMFISTMWMPWFSDKYGRRNAVIVSIFGSICGFLFTALAQNYGFLMFAKIFGGLFGGTKTVAEAFVVDLYGEKERGTHFNHLATAAISAFMFGPFIGGGLSQFGLRVPLWVATGCSIIAWTLTLKQVKDPKTLVGDQKKDDSLTPVKGDDEEVDKPLVDSDHHTSEVNKRRQSLETNEPTGILDESTETTETTETKSDTVTSSILLEEGQGKVQGKGEDIKSESSGINNASGAGEKNNEETINKDGESELEKEKEKEKEKKGTSEVAVNPNPYLSIQCWAIAIETGLTTLSFNALPSLLPLLLYDEKLGVVNGNMDLETQGERVALWVMTLVPALGFLQIVSMMKIYGKMVKKYGLLQVATVGCIIFGIGLILYPYYPHPGFMFISQVLLAIGNSWQTNCSNVYLSKYAPKDKVAKTLAMGSTADTVALMLGPIIMTNLYAKNEKAPFFLSFGLAIFASAICASLLWRYGDPNADKKKDEEQFNKEMEKFFAKDQEEQKEKSKQKELEKMETGEEGKVDAETLLFTQYKENIENMKPEEVAVMNKLGEFLYHQLVDKHHMSGLTSKRVAANGEKVSDRFLQAHEELLAETIDMWHDPNTDLESFTLYMKEVLTFFVAEGHQDWASEIPGASFLDLNKMLEAAQSK